MPMRLVCEDQEDQESDCREEIYDFAKPARKLSVLMPVFNEYWTLRTIVDRVLSSPIPLEIELIIVDDCSTDGSWELIEELAAADSRIKPLRHTRNSGKGSALRTAIRHITGEVAVVQDADLEYDPWEYPRLLEPILEGKADAVFGSRFVGHPRRAMFFWHSVVNKFLTLVSNMVNDLNLTDMETCYKMVRSDILTRLRLRSKTFTFEPELTCRLAQWGARVYEVPISYSGRTYEEGKKIRAVDGLRAIGEIFRCKFLDRQFTDHSGFYSLATTARSNRHNRRLVDLLKPYLGKRLLEAGSGIGNLSRLLLNRERLVLADCEPLYIPLLRQRFGRRQNVRIDWADLTRPVDCRQWQAERLDTVLCSSVLEHVEDDAGVLRSFFDLLEPGGHCVVVVPAGRLLDTPINETRGRCRRYLPAEAVEKMADAGFEIMHTRQFSPLVALPWAIFGRLFGDRRLNFRQMNWFDALVKLLDRLLPDAGTSLIVVGRKPQRMARRMAA
jgi:glycosyltransferase involved in cell wall biosynthesis